MDYEWSTKSRIITSPQPNCRIVIKLFEESSPLACENFKALCTGSLGKAKSSGLPLHYKNIRFHRIVPKFILQGGDFVMQNGTGGESIWGKKFKDDKLGLKLKHSKPGVVSMCNSGKNSNTCQFFFTLTTCPSLDGKHVVFGEIIHGLDVLEQMERAAVEGRADGKVDEVGEGEPKVSLIITECGIWDESMPKSGYWSPSGKFIEKLEVGGSGNQEKIKSELQAMIAFVYAPKQPVIEKFKSVLLEKSIVCESSTVLSELMKLLNQVENILGKTIIVIYTSSVIIEEQKIIQEYCIQHNYLHLCSRPADILQLLATHSLLTI